MPNYIKCTLVTVLLLGCATIIIAANPAARVDDMHTCPIVTPGIPPIPHVGGPILTGSANVIICGLQAATVGSAALCTGPLDLIIQGSPTVFINGQPAARLDDMSVHGGKIVQGCPTVIIGP